MNESSTDMVCAEPYKSTVISCMRVSVCMYVFVFLSICIVSFMYVPLTMIMVRASTTYVQKCVEISLLSVNWIRRRALSM